ncbi:ABC transporter permease [Asanoa sp. NPDC049573]|uniref:ABC transporter permease n=1 Tax=Asanoa sp. NPDC049573 TaxID=3155396 RepID=UPI003416627A
MLTATPLSTDYLRPSPPDGRLDRMGWAVRDSATVAGRELLHIRRLPEKLLDVVIQPVILVLLFSYVFGSAIVLPGGGDYREFLMPGIFVQSVFFVGAGTAAAVSLDMTEGVIERFRALPMARSALVAGRTLADLLGVALSLAIMAGCGLAVGWRTHRGPAAAIAAFGLLLLVGYATSWLATWVGLLARTPEAATAVSMGVVIPLTFVANTFVPTAGMPTWLRTVADWNPISAAVEACRYLFGDPVVRADGAAAGWPLSHPVAATLCWTTLLIAVAAPMAVRRYR